MEERFEAFLRVEDRGSHVTGDRKVLEYDWFPADNQERNVCSVDIDSTDKCVCSFSTVQQTWRYLSACIEKRVVLTYSIRSYSL